MGKTNFKPALRKRIVTAWFKHHRFVLLSVGIWPLLAIALLLFVSGCAEQAPEPPAAAPPAPEPELTVQGPTELAILESPFSGMAGKKVIIRNDDVAALDAGLLWLSDLIVNNGIKVTYSVIPDKLAKYPDVIDYLNNLDKEHFEMATHGSKIMFEGLPYEEQYSLIKQLTELMEEYLQVRPYTFVPPYSSDDVNTVMVCEALGYHSISTGEKYLTSYISDLAMIDFEWEYTYDPLVYNDYETFQKLFDDFYYLGESRSKDQFYVIILHHAGFLTDDKGQVRDDLKRDFENSIDYMKSKGVEFMTIEEAYQWHVDEPHIKVGQVNENAYFVDLASCQYDHTISFDSPPQWGGSVLIRDISTGETTQIKDDIVEFRGIKEHYYEILPVFKSSSLVISPDEVFGGQSLEVSVLITNTSNAASSCEVVLKINRTVEATQEVSIGAGVTQKVSFTLATDIPELYIAYRTYVVDVNGLTGSFLVKRN